VGAGTKTGAGWGRSEMCVSREEQNMTKENRAEDQLMDRVRESPSQQASLPTAAGPTGHSSRVGSCSVCC